MEQITVDLKKQLLHSLTYKEWESVGVRNHHGINIPLFSLRSALGCGIGEFLDLIPLIQWCHSIGFDVVQVLPLNDTGMDTSPYNSISAYALNPIHLSLAQLPNVANHPDLMSFLSDLQSLNALPRVDYEKVRKGKFHFLKEYYSKEATKINDTDEYRRFLQINPWLRGFALFKSIKEATGLQRWESWQDSYQKPDDAAIRQLESQYHDDIQYHLFEQFLCNQQMQKVKNLAASLGVLIKGDIPILISRDSADVWLHQSLFLLNFAAGAPPDMYNHEGQNWGFPVYNWSEIEKQGYQWWKERLVFSENFYHLYRLDHVVGFFRIWAFPENRPMQEAHFIPQDQQQWLPEGVKILTHLLASSTMLPIGEDLGTVPPEVRKELTNMGICGTKVMRWERMWNEDKRFIKPEDYPPVSMTTVSTHDSTTLALWWLESPEEAKEYCRFKGWEYQTPLPKKYLEAILWDSHHSGSLFHINLLQEYLSYFPELVWPNPEDERINVPGVISDRNWTYRFRPTIEELTQHQGLNNLIKSLIS